MGYACSRTMPNSCRAVANDQLATAEYPEGLTADEYYSEELPERVEAPETPAQLLARQSAKLKAFTQLAAAQKSALNNRVGTLQDAIELEMATPEEVAELPIRQAQLLEWKRYAVYLGRVTGQDGWPPDVEWPIQPSEGMDLTVSGVAPDSPAIQ